MLNKPEGCLYCDNGTVVAHKLCKLHWGRWYQKSPMEAPIKTNIRHGDCSSSEYGSWSSAKERIYNLNGKDYARYGGRGIKMCATWRDSYSNFLKDMGRKPSPKHSLDRINNNGDYEPSNCRWATIVEQNRNRRLHFMPAIEMEKLLKKLSMYEQLFGPLEL